VLQSLAEEVREMGELFRHIPHTSFFDVTETESSSLFHAAP